MPEFPFSWVTLFLVTSYLMGVACLYRGLRIGSVQGWTMGLREIGLFLLFCGLGYSVESWAHARTPYYYYSTEFPDRVPRIPFEKIPHFPLPPEKPCSDMVKDRVNETLNGREIPLTIPIMEGALAFAALWTSRRLNAPLLLRPFLAGMVLVNVDILLDPIVATTHSCSGAVLRTGLGFWHWYTDDAYISRLYGIPLFNFAGWYGAAVLLVSLAYLLHWGGQHTASRWGPKAWRSTELPPAKKGLMWLALVSGPALVLQLSPSLKHPLPHAAQWVIFLVMVVGTGVVVLRKSRRFHTNRSEEGDLTAILFLPVLFAVFAFLGSGQFMRTPTFLVAALITSATAALLCWWPYQEAILRFAQRLIFLDRFIRLHYVGYPWMLILLGAAFAAAPSLTAAKVGALLLVGLSFHIYSCVLNDVIDLDIDRTQVRRRNDPLVRGSIDRTTAHVFALIQLPIMALVTQLLRGDGVALLLIAVACVLMGIYNRWGKLCPIPPLTDLLQGVAWGTLALYGAWVAGGLAPIPWVVFAYGAGFMFLINGIHGGLRDLANDVSCKRTNTALFLGARPGGSDPYAVFSTWRIVAFAFAIQSAMIGLMARVLFHDPLSYFVPIYGITLEVGQPGHLLLWWGVALAFSGVAVWCHVLLWRLVKPDLARRDEAGSWHAFAILLLPLIVLGPALPRSMQVVVPLCFFLPLSVQYVEPIVGRFFPALRGQMSNAPEAAVAAVDPSLPEETS